MISYGVDYSFQLVDIFWVARIGVGAPTAIAVVSSIFFLILSANEVIGVSSVAILSQRFGEGNVERTGEAILQTLAFKALIGVVCALVFFAAVHFGLSAYELTEVEREYTIDYARVIWLSLLLVPVYSCLMTTLRAIGEAAVTSVISIVALATNVALSPLLIFGMGGLPELGISGAAYATVLAQILATAMCLVAIRRNRAGIPVLRRAFVRWQPRLYSSLILIGLPMGGVMLLYNLEQAIVTALVAKSGPDVSDGYGIGSRIFGLLFIVNFGISLGVSVTVGQSLGRSRSDLVRCSLPRLSLVIVCVVSFLSLMVGLFANTIVGAFSGVPETIGSGSTYLRYMAVANVGLALLYCVGGVFEGAGRNIPPLKVAVAMYLLFEFPILFSIWLLDAEDLRLIWAAAVVTSALGAVLMILQFRAGSWVHRVPT